MTKKENLQMAAAMKTTNNTTTLKPQSLLNVGLGIGDYVRNKKTGVRGDIMVIYSELAPYIKVVRHPSDSGGRWQTWDIEDVELMPNV